jgi:hypothetical protein
MITPPKPPESQNLPYIARLARGHTRINIDEIHLARELGQQRGQNIGRCRIVVRGLQ